MLPFRVILSHHSRQTHKSCATSALPLPCSLLNCQSKIPAGSGLLISSSNFKPFNLQTFKPLPLPTFPNPRLSVSSPVMRHCLATIMSGSPVTKSPVVHPLSVQLLIKCSSRNSFVLKTIHFDGGGTPAFLLTFLGAPLHIFALRKEATLLFSIDCALFCTFLHSAKNQLCCFQSIAHSLAKTPGGGGRGVPSKLLFFAYDLIVPRTPRQPALFGGELQGFFAVEFGLAAELLHPLGQNLPGICLCTLRGGLFRGDHERAP